MPQGKQTPDQMNDYRDKRLEQLKDVFPEFRIVKDLSTLGIVVASETAGFLLTYMEIRYLSEKNLIESVERMMCKTEVQP